MSALSSRRHAICVSLLAVLFAFSGAYAKRGQSTKIDIKPGPATMSPAEKALKADVKKGIEHGIVLLEETDRDDSLPSGYRIRYHLRAKILSNEARDLGDIVVPMTRESGSLRKFWARVIHPDGSTRELGKNALKRQVIAKSRNFSITELKAALPEVTPGSVIDYGYDINMAFLAMPPGIPLQRRWPVKKLRLRWQPSNKLSSAYFISGPKDLPIQVTTANNSVLIKATDLAPLDNETYAPPLSEIGAYFYPYYRYSSAFGKEYWDELADDIERDIKSFCGSSSKRKKLLTKIGIPATGDTREHLTSLYNWILKEVQNTSALNAAEWAVWKTEKHKEDKKVNNAADLLEHRHASRWQITLFFAGLARHIGARAFIIKAVDRTDRYFKPTMCTKSQFSTSFVEIHLPGKDRAYYLDPGDAMPFGQVAWWATGVSAFKATPEGAQIVGVPAASAWQNQLFSAAEIAFIDDNEALEISWSTRAKGQTMLMRRRALRRLAPQALKERLLKLCGDSADFEVDEAKTANLEPLVGDYELHCNGEAIVSGIEDNTTNYSFHFNGLWVHPVPELNTGERKHAVIFPFPSVVKNEIIVHAPEGFITGQMPSPVQIDGPAGKYSLVISMNNDSYTVKREFSIKPLIFKTKYYKLLTDYLDQVRRADQTPLIFRRSTGGV